MTQRFYFWICVCVCVYIYIYIDTHNTNLTEHMNSCVHCNIIYSMWKCIIYKDVEEPHVPINRGVNEEVVVQTHYDMSLSHKKE